MLTTCNGVGTSERAILFCKIEKTEATTDVIDGEINKDSKKIEQEKLKSKQDAETKQIRSELSKYNKKKMDSDFVAKMKFYFKQPSRVILYLLMLMTIIIYIVIIIKKLKLKNNIIKEKKIKKMSRIERKSYDTIKY